MTRCILSILTLTGLMALSGLAAQAQEGWYETEEWFPNYQYDDRVPVEPAPEERHGTAYRDRPGAFDETGIYEDYYDRWDYTYQYDDRDDEDPWWSFDAYYDYYDYDR